VDGGNMTKKEYIRYFNLEMKFNNMIKKYLVEYVLQEDEILDTRAISHSFTKNDQLCINYFITDLSEDLGKRTYNVSRIEFEKIMGFEGLWIK